MAIIGQGLTTSIQLRNRPTIPTIPVTPGIIFSDYTPTSQFSFCIWAKAVFGTVGTSLISIQGTNGSFISINHELGAWILKSRNVNVALPSLFIASVMLGRWILFAFTKNGPTITVYVGIEGDPADPDNLVSINHAFDATPELAFNFNQIVISSTNQTAICNFKYWKTAISQSELQAQGNKWMNTNSSDVIDSSLIWSSPLRVPGDLSSIVDPGTPNTEVDNWSRHHAYTGITFQDRLDYTIDPAYMAKHTVCAAWLYPSFKDIDVNTPIQCIINPGTAPSIPTFYKAPELWKYEDKGSIPLSPAQSITYFGFPLNQADRGSGDIWGYFIDENGVDQSNTTDSNYRFLQIDTGIFVPVSLTPVNIYQWQFGAQARFLTTVPPNQPVQQQGLFDMHLFVTYIGSPTGIPFVPEIDLTGLFVIKKAGESVDQYNRGVRLKIPNPTIRTAFIGE